MLASESLLSQSHSCLIIDDDTDEHEIFQICLGKIGIDFRCLAMSDAEATVTMLRSSRDFIPNYIFLDINMPKMNGIECLKELKSITYLADTKIIMYSTSFEGSIFNQCKMLGAHDFIIKPSSMSVLITRLQDIFREMN